VVLRTEHLDPKLTPKDAPSTPSTPSRPSSRPPGPAGLDSPSGSAASLPSTVSGTADGGAAGEDASKDVLLDLLETPVDPDNPESQKKILAKLEGKQDSDVEALYKSTRARALKFRPTLLPPPPPPIDFQAYFSPELAAPSGAGGGSSSNLLLKQQAPPAVASPVAGEAPYIHVGRPIVQKEVTQSIKATLWMSTSFPLFVEQLFPILTIMSPTNEHFARLKEFIELKLPRGFPIKIGASLALGAARHRSAACANRRGGCALAGRLRSRDPALWRADGQGHVPGVPDRARAGRGPVQGAQRLRRGRGQVQGHVLEYSLYSVWSSSIANLNVVVSRCHVRQEGTSCECICFGSLTRAPSALPSFVHSPHARAPPHVRPHLRCSSSDVGFSMSAFQRLENRAIVAPSMMRWSADHDTAITSAA